MDVVRKLTANQGLLDIKNQPNFYIEFFLACIVLLQKNVKGMLILIKGYNTNIGELWNALKLQILIWKYVKLKYSG